MFLIGACGAGCTPANCSVKKAGLCRHPALHQTWQQSLQMQLSDATAVGEAGTDAAVLCISLCAASCHAREVTCVAALLQMLLSAAQAGGHR